ncbi:MAG TPA: penicillin-binding protein 2 [Anaerolineae bacterium]|nr:penicillin-binding protein 2 [Anaerolineae bacterium]HQK14213.1 penicillin-binding protein 2 [Anaerolineae bacterium]
MLRGPDARLRLIAILLIAALLPILGQLVRLQILEHSRYQSEAEALVQRQYALPASPWGVVMDRNGDLLVGNLPVYDIGAEISMITDTQMAASVLAPLLNVPEAQLLKTLTLPQDAHGIVWRPLAYHIPEVSAQKIKALGWPWITMSPGWERYYAEGALAAHTLGFVNARGVGYGVQAFQARFLQSESLSRTGTLGGDDSPMVNELINNSFVPYRGTDLRLTIDRTIQAYVEGVLDQALVDYKATGGTILVLNVRTGEVLAVASRPHYEPYHYADYVQNGQESLFRDPAASISYEPGSVFKIVTVAAALDSGRVDLNWTYEDTGALEYGGAVIYNSSRAAYGRQGLQGILDHSLNVGVATLTTRVLGAELFYKYVRAFGFGKTTGLEVTGEASGLVHLPTDWDWSDSNLATNAFGQGIAVTPLQMAVAAAAIANDGVMMQPHIVAERYYPDGRAVPIPPNELGRPISAETARTVTELMARSVEKFAKEAQVPGYRVAGKSGTAQIPTTGGYDPQQVITSYVGFGPLPDPQVVILVKLDRPDVPLSMRWGTQTAAPVFQKVAARVFILLGLPPSDLHAGP